jgi:hypothetical protein
MGASEALLLLLLGPVVLGMQMPSGWQGLRQMLLHLRASGTHHQAKVSVDTSFAGVGSLCLGT